MKTTTKPPRPELSFDGCGINGSDQYRTRIATFSNDADRYGPLFAAAPELLEALEIVMESMQGVPEFEDEFKLANGWTVRPIGKVAAAIARATGKGGEL